MIINIINTVLLLVVVVLILLLLLLSLLSLVLLLLLVVVLLLSLLAVAVWLLSRIHSLIHFINQRWSATGCNSTCSTGWDPVCGSNGITYENECYFNKAACINPALTLASRSQCGEQGITLRPCLLHQHIYPISTLPEHLHSIFPSYAKIPENTLTEKKKFLFPPLTLITCLTGPPVTPPPSLGDPATPSHTQPFYS